ncbi:SMI1/KNR4 family protein [Enorma phocaeensis]|uniref:SMI1/KNR4 family protein n=1 Tax=Enorma phocaeensis TaxID=1871019 RepID=UPI002353B730|nr:SMI1/KNR4 family protein [Enorma phocaeensis]
MQFDDRTIEQLNAFIPHKPVDEEAVARAERILHTTFAPEYRAIQLKYGRITCYGHEITGIDSPNRLDVVSRTIELRRSNPVIPQSWYVIEELHIDCICAWQSPLGNIYYAQPGAIPKRITNSLVAYLSL